MNSKCKVEKCLCKTSGFLNGLCEMKKNVNICVTGLQSKEQYLLFKRVCSLLKKKEKKAWLAGRRFVGNFLG